LNDSHLVPNVFIRRQLGEFLADEDKARRLLKSHNISASVLTDNGYTESSKLASLANTVWRLSDDESTAGAKRKLRSGSFKMLCHACSDCKTLKAVIYRTCDFFKLLDDDFQFSLDVKGEEAILTLSQHSKSMNSDYFIMCLSIVFIRWYSWLINETIKLDRVEFIFPAFTSISDFEAIYHSAVNFDHASNRFIFSSKLLNKTILVNQDKLSVLLINSPHCFLSHYRPQDSTAELVRKSLTNSDNFAQIKLADIAEQLHCSTATLTRKLKAEQTSFMEIKDRSRKSKALSLLRIKTMPLNEIAYKLGFSEASAFTRAFKKWTGDSPAEYRTNINI